MIARLSASARTLARPLQGLLGIAGRTRRAFAGASRAADTARQTVAVVPQAIEAILVLPSMIEQLDRICRNTDALPGVLANLERVAADTSVLPGMQDEIGTMNGTVVRMQEDTGMIAIHIPKLVVLEQSLPAMVPVLEDIDRTVQRLADVAEPLQGAAQRFGRFTDRLPQRNGRHG